MTDRQPIYSTDYTDYRPLPGYVPFWQVNRRIAKWALAAAVLFGALGFAAGRAFADPLSIRGTTVTLEPAPPPAVALVTMNNLSVNDDRDNGVYFVAMPGLLVEVEFTWNAGIAGSDRITVLPPDGFVCEPRDCAATVLENESGTVLLLEWIGG